MNRYSGFATETKEKLILSKYLKYTKRNKDCLEWTRALNSDGYPRAGTKNNSNLKVHREVFYDTYGHYPKVVRHTCDNIICINPDHLVGGTNIDNVKDRQQRGRTYNQVSPEQLEEALSLRSEGLTMREIGQSLEIKMKRVEYILNLDRKES